MRPIADLNFDLGTLRKQPSRFANRLRSNFFGHWDLDLPRTLRPPLSVTVPGSALPLTAPLPGHRENQHRIENRRAGKEKVEGCKRVNGPPTRGLGKRGETRRARRSLPCGPALLGILTHAISCPISAKACQNNFQALRELSPRSARGRPLFRPLRELHKGTAMLSWIVRQQFTSPFTIAGLRPTPPEHFAGTSAPARSKPRPCRLLPTAKPSLEIAYPTKVGREDLVRIRLLQRSRDVRRR